MDVWGIADKISMPKAVSYSHWWLWHWVNWITTYLVCEGLYIIIVGLWIKKGMKWCFSWFYKLWSVPYIVRPQNGPTFWNYIKYNQSEWVKQESIAPKDNIK